MHKFLAFNTKSLEQNGVVTHKELWEKAQKDGYTGLSLALGTEITKDAETKKFHAVFSSAVEDRHGEIVFQDFDLKAFKKNPVYLDSHRYNSIEDIIGRVSGISVKEGKLQGDIEFASFNPKGALAEKLAEEGFLNTSSIGFIPKAFDEKGNILKSEMLEISAVSVPANPEALIGDKKTIEEPVVEDTPVEDIPAPVIEEPSEIAGKKSPNMIVGDFLADVQKQRALQLHAVAREIKRFQEPGAQKRQVFKAVRELLKADIAA